MNTALSDIQRNQLSNLPAMREALPQTLRARYVSLLRQNAANLQGFVSRLKRRIGAAT